MNYADIKRVDVANGEGVRVSVFVSGCNHHCKGCFNECAWDFNYGNKFTDEQIDQVINYLDHDYISGLTLLGGEPLGTMQDYLNTTCIKEAKNEKIQDNVMFENVIKDLEILLKKVTDIKKKADESNNYATSSLMDEYISNYIKKLWMLKQMMQ